MPRSDQGEWRNWQTRMLEVHVSERTWGFKSPLAHNGEPQSPVATTPAFSIISTAVRTGTTGRCSIPAGTE